MLHQIRFPQNLSLDLLFQPDELIAKALLCTVHMIISVRKHRGCNLLVPDDMRDRAPQLLHAFAVGDLHLRMMHLESWKGLRSKIRSTFWAGRLRPLQMVVH